MLHFLILTCVCPRHNYFTSPQNLLEVCGSKSVRWQHLQGLALHSCSFIKDPPVVGRKVGVYCILKLLHWASEPLRGKPLCLSILNLTEMTTKSRKTQSNVKGVVIKVGNTSVSFRLDCFHVRDHNEVMETKFKQFY